MGRTHGARSPPRFPLDAEAELRSEYHAQKEVVRDRRLLQTDVSSAGPAAVRCSQTVALNIPRKLPEGRVVRTPILAVWKPLDS